MSVQFNRKYCKNCETKKLCEKGYIAWCEKRDGGKPPEGSEVVELDREDVNEILANESVNKPESEDKKDNDRKIYLEEEINRESILPITKRILDLNKEDTGIPVEWREPIRLYISSDGGNEAAGNLLISAIRNSKTPVYTINLGGALSMAFLIYITGHKRYAFKNSEFLMHEGTIEIEPYATSKAIDIMKFQEKRNERARQLVLECGDIDASFYDGKLCKEWYLFADEAKEYGFVDYIIGEDVPLEEVTG